MFFLPVLTLAGCNGGKNLTNIELIQGMMDQISIKSQDWDPKQGDKVQMRMPPEGTVPRGFTPYKYATDPEGAEKNVANPFAGDDSPQMIERGKKYFSINCAVCHGPSGKGDGTVVEKMPVKPPSLLSDKVKNFKDGRIFHIMTAGQGVMGSYASQITDPDNRWAVVNYVRNLQKQGK
jgi:mono/diheme cytochrome c family protein